MKIFNKKMKEEIKTLINTIEFCFSLLFFPAGVKDPSGF